MTRPAEGSYRDALVEHVTGDVVAPVRLVETAEDRESIARVKRLAEIWNARPDHKPPRWSSARAAIAAYAQHVTYGATAKSPSNLLSKTLDAMRGTSDGVLAPREEPVRYDQRGAEWVAEVARALDAAYTAPWCVHVSPERVEIPAGYCRTILLLRVVGKPVQQAMDRTAGDRPGERAGDTSKAWRHARIVQWVEQPASQLADDVSGYLKHEVTVGAIAAVVRHGLREVTVTLSAAGLVPEPRRREESGEMASSDPDRLSGWKAIATCLDLEDESSARRWHARYPGMPVSFTPSGRVYASRAALTSWLADESRRVQRMAGASS